MWKSKRLSDESIKAPARSDNSLVPSLTYIGFRPRLNFDDQRLKLEKVTFIQKILVSIY